MIPKRVAMKDLFFRWWTVYGNFLWLRILCRHWGEGGGLKPHFIIIVCWIPFFEIWPSMHPSSREAELFLTILKPNPDWVWIFVVSVYGTFLVENNAVQEIFESSVLIHGGDFTFHRSSFPAWFFPNFSESIHHSLGSIRRTHWIIHSFDPGKSTLSDNNLWISENDSIINSTQSGEILAESNQRTYRS